VTGRGRARQARIGAGADPVLVVRDVPPKDLVRRILCAMS
jgi:hypothetical protein